MGAVLGRDGGTDESMSPQFGISQLSRWRSQLRGGAAVAEAPLSPAIVAVGSAAAVRTESRAIEIDFANGARMRITGTGPIDDSVIGAVIAAPAKTWE